MAKLTDVCDFQGGSQPPKEEWSFEEQDGYIRMLQIRDFTQSERVTPEYIKISGSTKTCDADDILIARYGASLGKILTGLSGAYNVAIMRTIPDETILTKEYLYYYLKSPYFQTSILNVGSRAAQAGFNKDDLSKLEIKCPSFEQQGNIVQVLQRVESVIKNREAELEKLNELVKARFVEMFGSQEFERKQLIDLIQEGAGLSYGIVVPGDNVSDGIPMVRPSDFKNGRLNLDNVYRVALDIECKYKKTRLLGDEILVQVIGQPGQVMLSDERCKGMNVTRNLAVIRIDKNKADRLFISHYLTTEEAQRFMFGSTNQSTLKQLPLNKLKELPVPMVPISDQVQFADFVKQVDKSKVAVQKALDETKKLFDSLMQEYFG